MDRIDTEADKRYYKIDDIEACEAGGVTAHVPKPVDRSPMKKKGLFTKSRFRYAGATDSYACPGGHRLRPTYFHQLAGGRGEFSLTALAYNMGRAINLVGVSALVAAAAA